MVKKKQKLLKKRFNLDTMNIAQRKFRSMNPHLFGPEPTWAEPIKNPKKYRKEDT